MTIHLKALATLATVLLLTAGCGSQESRTEPTEPAGSLVDDDPALVQPGSLVVDRSISTDDAAHVVQTAQRLYTFWDSGDTTYLDQAVSDDFVDNTLPAGRPQGPTGPSEASKGFRAAVPDLECELVDLYVVDDTFTAHLTFRGHFSGTYNGVQGQGQPIEFTAIDIQHLGDGQTITEDWHLEDNLTFLQQAGLVTIAGTPD